MPEHTELLPASEVERAKRLIKRKYRFDLLFVGPIRAIQALFDPERRHEVTAIIIAITARAPERTARARSTRPRASRQSEEVGERLRR